MYHTIPNSVSLEWQHAANAKAGLFSLHKLGGNARQRSDSPSTPRGENQDIEFAGRRRATSAGRLTPGLCPAKSARVALASVQGSSLGSESPPHSHGESWTANDDTYKQIESSMCLIQACEISIIPPLRHLMSHTFSTHPVMSHWNSCPGCERG